MRLCFGTYCAVLSVCLTPIGDTRKLCEEMFKTVAPNHGVVTRDSSHAAASGKSNLPGDVLEAAADIDTPEKAKEVAQQFNAKVIKYLELNKRKEIVLALQDVIRTDDIGDDVVVDLVDGLTKAQIAGLKEFVLDDFLAGVFLYTCQTSNSKMEKYIKEVTEDYVHSFANQAAFISFVGSYSASSIDVAKSIGADSVALALVAEAGGNCLKCGRKIASLASGSGVDYATRVKLTPEEDAVFCVDCARQLHTLSQGELQRLLEKKKDFHIRSMAREAMSKHSLSTEIRKALLAISIMKASPETELKEKPTKVENKVQDEALKDLILLRVTRRYNGVNKILYQLSGEDKVVMDEHAKIIRRMYEDAKDVKGLNQDGIFNELVNEICAQTSSDMRTAAEIVVSYFVQRCEVFDETSKQGDPVFAIGNSPLPSDTGDHITEGHIAKGTA